MIIYNVTINVSDEIHDTWLNWMKEKHIPDLLSTNLFVSASLSRVITNSDTGTTYAVAYKLKNLADLQKYETKFSNRFREEYNSKFSASAPTFRTVMQVEETF